MRLWKIVIGTLCYALGSSACAQLYTDYAYPNTLYNVILNQFAGSGVQISNVQFTGFNLNNNTEIKDIGTFNAQNTSLGVDNGSQTIILTANDACGQIASDTAFVQIGYPPVANFTYNPLCSDILHPTVNFIDASSADVIEWLWDLGEGGESTEQNPSFQYTFSDTNSIVLIVTNGLGCIDTTTQILIIHDVPGIYIPNAFTPNNDAINDVFMVYGREITFFDMQIFDRWGNKVFHVKNPNSGWDGTYNTVPVSAGVYSVKVEYSFSNSSNETRTIIGRLHLIR